MIKMSLYKKRDLEGCLLQHFLKDSSRVVSPDESMHYPLKPHVNHISLQASQGCMNEEK
jgi:hypothetical protein